jgi:hypothetical protein
MAKIVKSFKELSTLISKNKEVWVELHDGLKVCLVGVRSDKEELFNAKFFPCVRSARTHAISYKQIKTVTGDKK